jgi:2-polyprenyl-6-methoxyphenol hydroxylase-like FAD-dependent oxidoreductase
MSKIVICGGGPIGLCTAMMLGRDGHRVTVLEADRADHPETSIGGWNSWDRPGVAQFRQPHSLHSRFRMISDVELPELTDGLLRAGCVWVDNLDSESLPPTITDRAPRPGDEAMRCVAGRRPVIEWAVAALAQNAPNVTILRGVKVQRLITGASAIPGVPHVAGVCTTSGERIAADLVVDAMGRRSLAGEWIIDAGGQSPTEEAQDCNFVYFTRYFSGSQQPRRTGRTLTPMGQFSILTLHGDNDTWSITLFTSAKNKGMRALRDATTFHRVVSACPQQAHWLDGKPISPVHVLAGVLDRYRRFAIDGRPVITGFATVGDAWACTNPSAGRGLSVGLLHAQVLRDVVRRKLDEPAALAQEFDTETERQVGPFYRDQIAADRARITEMSALATGTSVPPINPIIARLFAAAAHDADVFRAVLEIAMCVSLPRDVIARPHIAAKLAEWGGCSLPPERYVIDRDRMANLLSG